jgi:TPR repeat protein
MTADAKKSANVQFEGDPVCAYKAGHYELALAQWRVRAEADDAEAAAWIGSCYANGDGVDVDDAQAFEWYRRSAELGHVPAQANLGAFYFMGRGVAKDAAEAVRWLGRAAESGDQNGMFNLAHLYAQGACVAQDLERAAALYRRASELGHYPSQSRLGYMYARGEGATKDRVEAYLWLTLAAQHGIGTALNELEGVVKEMSSEEKARGAGLFEQWRFKTRSAAGPTALYPLPT